MRRQLWFHLLALGATSTAAAQSTMFRGGPDHLGNYTGPVPTLDSVAWKFKTGGRVISSPAVAGGLVVVGSADGSLYGINRSDGTQRWKFDTKGPVMSSPAIADGLVYVSSVDGNIYAVDTATGTQRWVFATKGERRFTAPGIHGAIPSTERMPDPFDVFLSSPTVAGGTVYIGSGDQHVYALDARTGALKWAFATGDVVHAAPALANNTVYIGSWDRNLYALDAATGKEKWRYTTANDTTIYNQIGLASSPAVANGMVFVGGRKVPRGPRARRQAGVEARQPGRLDHRLTRGARRRGLFPHLRRDPVQSARGGNRYREVRSAEQGGVVLVAGAGG